MEAFIISRVARAWRRPVTDAERAGLMKLYMDAAATDGAARGFSLMVQAAVQAAPFIYRTEVGTGAATATTPVQMTAYELASALGFLLFDSIPDDSLWGKAVDGSILQPAVLDAELRRLLALPRVQGNVTKLIGYWAGVEVIPGQTKDDVLFPQFTTQLKASLYGSVQAFLGEVVWNGKFADLFSSRRVYVDSSLSSVYGLPAGTASGLVPVDVPAGQPSAGLLTQPGFLASTNKRTNRGDPIHRGLGIYYAFVCGATLPDPPPGALEAGKLMVGNERQRAEQRAANPICSGCHSSFDPLGLTTEQFDPIGRYSPSDELGQPIDASATLANLGPDLDGFIGGIEALAAKLRASRRASDCAAGTLASNALGYANEIQSCDLSQAKDVFAKTGSFVEFITTLVKSKGFVMRAPR